MEQKEKNQYIKKVRDFIAKDNLDDAIVEVSHLAASSEEVNQIILQSSINESLKRQLRYGTIRPVDARVLRNRVIKSILEILDIIEIKSNNQIVVKQLEDYEKERIEVKVVRTVEGLYQLSKEILNDNQKILTPLLFPVQKSFFIIIKNIFNFKADDCIKQETVKKMVILFNHQKSRGTLSRWSYFFEEIQSMENISVVFKYEIIKINTIINNLNETLYSHMKSNGFGVIEWILENDPFLEDKTNIERIRAAISKSIFNKIYFYSDKAIKLIINQYLEHLRSIHSDIAIQLEKLKIMTGQSHRPINCYKKFL